MKLYPHMVVPLVLVVLFWPLAALAQVYPAKPVRVVVPWPPGGANDVTARIVFQKMSEMLKEQFIIENRGGATGTIGAAAVARSAPDGYTLMVHSATHVANPHLFKKLPYDTINDFIGVTTLARQVGALIVHPSLPVTSMKGFIALAGKRPGEVIYGSAGSGSTLHLMMAQLLSMTGIKVVHVPYKGGGPAVIAIVSGETQAMYAVISDIYSHLMSKRVRPLGVTSADRLKQFPDVPAIGETVPGYAFTSWMGAFVPAGTPKPIIDKLNADLKRALDAPDVASKLDTLVLLDPSRLTPGEFAQLLKSDHDRLGKLIRELGLTTID